MHIHMPACQSAYAAGAVYAALRCILYTALTHTQAMPAMESRYSAVLCCAMLSVVCCRNATLLWQGCPRHLLEVVWWCGCGVGTVPCCVVLSSAACLRAGVQCSPAVGL